MKRCFLLLTLVFSFQFSSAQGECWNCWNPPLNCYINFFGAANWCQVDSFDANVSTKLGFLAGTGLGLQLGYWFPALPYSRLEVEYSIRKNQLWKVENGGIILPLNGSASTNCWMVDFYQDFPFFGGYFFPFVGAGAGYSYRNSMKEVEIFTGEKDKSDGFAWQIVTGVSTFVNIATLLSLEYRYFSSPRNLQQQSVGLSLRYLY
jgi:opacity protein-like surface antigen